MDQNTGLIQAQKKRRVASNNVTFIAEIALICLGAIIRILYCIVYPVQTRDAYHYMNIAESWIKNGTIEKPTVFFPFSIWVMKIPCHFFYCRVQIAGITTNVIIGLLLILICMRISKMICNSEIITITAGLLMATHPSLVYFSCNYMRENVYLLNCCLCIYFLLKYLKKSNTFYVGFAGVFTALAIMARLEGAELIPIALLCIVAYNIKRRKYIKMVLLTGLFLFFILASIYLFCMVIDYDIQDLIYIARYPSSKMKVL